MNALKKWVAGTFCREDGTISTAKVGSSKATVERADWKRKKDALKEAME